MIAMTNSRGRVSYAGHCHCRSRAWAEKLGHFFLYSGVDSVAVNEILKHPTAPQRGREPFPERRAETAARLSLPEYTVLSLNDVQSLRNELRLGVVVCGGTF